MRAMTVRMGCVALSLSWMVSHCGGRRDPAASAPVTVASAAAETHAPAPPMGETSAVPSTASPEPDPPAATGAPPPPLPPTAKLARGTGSPGDAALAAGDAAYDADDFVKAEEKYGEAAKLAPKDAAPLVGSARVVIAKTN